MIKIASGDIQATVNSEDKFGWCGLRDLSHTNYNKEWLLSPALTLEHYLGIPFAAKDYIDYEPCMSSRRLEAISPEVCRLRYEPLSCSQIECSLTYRGLAPHYVDIVAEVKTNRKNWPFNYMALFFATIVSAPVYSGINFLGRDSARAVKGGPSWMHFNGLAANPGRVAHPDGVTQPELTRPNNPPDTYYFDDSSIRFELPFFYAHIETMVFMVMFHPSNRENVRFVVNPVAPAFGGPAWDFFWIIEGPLPDQLYSLSFRTMFKPFVSIEDVSREYETFIRDEKV